MALQRNKEHADALEETGLKMSARASNFYEGHGGFYVFAVNWPVLLTI